MSCGKKDVKIASQDKINKEYYKIMREFDNENYNLALQSFEKFTKQYSVNPIAKQSLQMEIFLQYVAEKYKESIALSDMYIKLYAIDNIGVEYAHYMTIMGMYKGIKDVDAGVDVALQLAGYIGNNLPKIKNEDYRSDISWRLQKIYLFITISKIIAGDTYFNANQYISAMIQYQEAIKMYQKIGDTKLITINEIQNRVNAINKIIGIE
ncbi:outer membrane protein assembly factor BamD [Candidatus Deianiraea vastatrix]|uniref:Outer membrane protein assembly factor BamD n=1 Tax=Candidatus Deianiraea vastatrix TaxID=2163644 RepID=A0A5B8XG81_9RICK|nr:outer membrane protein assembly factor BamD [Candidatus Deianiraea vastatrix]QED23241.1 Outer membrane protein assembly factor BamD [Candidatus Deianiraea vastatrix]